MKRLLWIDISKGLAILFVAYFHFFTTYFEHGVVPPPDWSNIAACATTILRLVWLKISGLGFHAVGVFIILSGWTLMQSTARRAEKGQIAWGGWYWARLYGFTDVLGRAPGLSRFAIRRTARTGRRSDHPEPARPAVHRYSDELHVSQRSVVVLLHADSVLSNLSPPLLVGATCWTLVVFVYRMRCWIFRPLRFAGAVASRWFVGPRRVRNLSIT